MFPLTDILEEVLVLDLNTITDSLPLPAGAETTLTIKTVGSLRLADLPDQMLMSPNSSMESKHRASSAVSLLTSVYCIYMYFSRILLYVVTY